MYLDQAYRQIAFVAYGNEFLNGSVDSEILDRHPLLFNHFPILRDLERGILLCGSASHMLEYFKSLDATKISLHRSSDLVPHLIDSNFFYFSNEDSSFGILVHFKDQTFIALIPSNEKATLQVYDDTGYPIHSNYSNYYDNTEVYTSHPVPDQSIVAIKKDLMPIDWQSYFEYAQNKLYENDIAKRYGLYPIPFESNNCYEGDLFNSIKEEKYPLLPFTIHKNYASNLIENSALLTRQYATASHCKNEYNDYLQMNDEEKKQFASARNNLTALHPIILKYCANHYQNSGFLNTNYLSGISQSSVLISSNLQIEPFSIYATSATETNHPHTSNEDKPIPSRLLGLFKFGWYLIWCYCAIWTLTYLVLHWGNIVITTIALLYAIYKITKS